MLCVGTVRAAHVLHPQTLQSLYGSASLEDDVAVSVAFGPKGCVIAGQHKHTLLLHNYNDPSPKAKNVIQGYEISTIQMFEQILIYGTKCGHVVVLVNGYHHATHKIHTRQINQIMYIKEQESIITCSDDGFIKFSTIQNLYTYSSTNWHGLPVKSMCIFMNLLLSTGLDENLVIQDMNNLNAPPVLNLHITDICKVACTDTSIYVIAGSKLMKVNKLSTDKEAQADELLETIYQTPNEEKLHHLFVSNLCSQIYTCTQQHLLMINVSGGVTQLMLPDILGFSFFRQQFRADQGVQFHRGFSINNDLETLETTPAKHACETEIPIEISLDYLADHALKEMNKQKQEQEQQSINMSDEIFEKLLQVAQIEQQFI